MTGSPLPQSSSPARALSKMVIAESGQQPLGAAERTKKIIVGDKDAMELLKPNNVSGGQEDLKNDGSVPPEPSPLLSPHIAAPSGKENQLR